MNLTRTFNWKVRYTIFPNTKFANSGMNKFVRARDLSSAVKKVTKGSRGTIRIDGITR